MHYKNNHFIMVIALAGGLAACSSIYAQNDPLSHSIFSDMMILQESSSARFSSSDSTGKNYDAVNLESGQTMEIVNFEGAGCFRHIYFTVLDVTPHYLLDMVIRMYWDGEEEPSVEVPFGDLFGMRYERVRLFQSLMVTVNQGRSNPILFGSHGFNTYFPMPFSDGARITLTNDGEQAIGPIWYHFDYETMDSIPGNFGRFHAQWRRENPTQAIGEPKNTTMNPNVNNTGDENYVILEAEGQGNLAGYFLHIDNIRGKWYGEGDDMIFIDGEGWPPSINGTGSEEIFGGGACPNTEYTGPYTGWLYAGNRDHSGKNSMYRYYVTDPVRFQKSIRVTIEHGHANNYSNDYSSTAFWYQSEPHASFPPLLAAVERYPIVGNSTNDIAWSKLSELKAKYIQLLYSIPEGIPDDEKIRNTEKLSPVPGCYSRAYDAFVERNHPVTIAESEEGLAIIEKLQKKYQ